MPHRNLYPWEYESEDEHQVREQDAFQEQAEEAIRSQAAAVAEREEAERAAEQEAQQRLEVEQLEEESQRQQFEAAVAEQMRQEEEQRAEEERRQAEVQVEEARKFTEAVGGFLGREYRDEADRFEAAANSQIAVEQEPEYYGFHEPGGRFVSSQEAILGGRAELSLPETGPTSDLGELGAKLRRLPVSLTELGLRGGTRLTEEALGELMGLASGPWVVSRQ